MSNKITERDIFNFVFFPENVSLEIRKYLEDSTNLKEGVEFYESLKNSLTNDLLVK